MKKTEVRPVMLFGLETETLRRGQEAEMKMKRFSLGGTKMDIFI